MGTEIHESIMKTELSAQIFTVKTDGTYSHTEYIGDFLTAFA